MNYQLETLLVNVLFILVPIFLYQMFWLDKDRTNSKWNRPVLILLLSTSIVLDMSFPIMFFPGFMFDLRQIPFILGALYGGYRVSGWLLLTIVSYRLIFDGTGIYVNFFVVALIALCVPLLTKRFKKMKLNEKILTSIILSQISALLTILLSHFFTSTPLLFSHSSFNYFLIQGFAMWLIAYIIETMLRNYQMRKELIKAEKMHVVSQIAASISHEVKNPITVTHGFVELLEDEDSKEKRQEYVKYALEELYRAQTIISEFLKLAKPELDCVEMVNVSHEIAYVANLMKPYAKQHAIVIKMERLDEDCFIVGDRQKIRQCFINIVKNSIEAMLNGGELRLKTINSTNRIYIDIIDTGIGMTNEEVSKIGTPYFTTKESGTGLGMMVVFNVIKNMNGEIKIESEKGKGTRFIIIFPYAA